MIPNKTRSQTALPFTIARTSFGICASVLLLQALPGAARASTFVEENVTCPVGGETFKYMAFASYSTFGAYPDGMPIGSAYFPLALPQCPKNGLVMYRDFTADEVTRLSPYIASPEYVALRAAEETPYYLAYRTAKFVGDPDTHWLLLSASWEAKNADAAGALARRYNKEFVDAVRALVADAQNFGSIAARFRAANALRELGRFAEAEEMRAAIVIASDAGGSDGDAADNREGWGKFVASLEAPIKRNDTSRAPIDMLSEREAVQRCLSKEIAEKFKLPPQPPLTTFELSFCEKPELAASMAEMKQQIRERDE
jgi:hypothetical protein